jgi:hypothetical protein
MTDTSIKELELLFPKKEYTLHEGVTIEISPLSLEDLPKVADSFSSLAGLIGEGKTVQQIVTLAISEILSLAKYCLSVPPRVVPMQSVPDILEIMIEQNMNEDIVKKWTTLIERVREELGQGEQESPNDSQK